MSEESGGKPELRSRRITVMGRRRSRAHDEEGSDTEARDTDPLPPPPDGADGEDLRQTLPRDPPVPAELSADGESGDRPSEPEVLTNPRIVIDAAPDDGDEDDEDDEESEPHRAPPVVVIAPARIISDAPPAVDADAGPRVEIAVPVEVAAAEPPSAEPAEPDDSEPEIEVSTLPGTIEIATLPGTVAAPLAPQPSASVPPPAPVPPRISAAPPPVPPAALADVSVRGSAPTAPAPQPVVSRPPPPPPSATAARDAVPPGDQWVDFEAEEETSLSDADAAEADMAELEKSDTEKGEGRASETPRRRTPPPPPSEPVKAPPVTSPAPRKPPPPPAPAAKAAAAGDDDKTKRKRARQWWERFFSDDYLLTVLPPTQPQISRQVDFIEQSLGLPKGAMILDVGCGLGLHAVELSRRGYLVVGLDLSLPMITRAAESAQEQGLKINFLHADIREIEFDGAFDAVICMGTTFGFFDDESNRDVLHRLFQALRPGGRILVDVVNRDYVVRWQPNLVWFEGDGCVCMEESDFNYFNSRLVVKRTVMHEDGHQTQSEYSLRVYSLHELGQVVQQLGFRVIEVSGQEATRGVFFGSCSSRILMLAERRVPGRASVVMPERGSMVMPERVTGEVPRPPSNGGEPPKPPPPTKS